MAREFGKKFLGSVPIDPAFVVLVEEGTRPRYPEGTMVEGKDVGGVEAREGDDEGLLVEKYTSCSLYPIFDGVVRELRRDIETAEV